MQLAEKCFKMRIEPAMLYGAEIWGQGKEIKKFDTVIAGLAKEVLGVKRSVPNLAALKELGWILTSGKAEIRQIKVE